LVVLTVTFKVSVAANRPADKNDANKMRREIFLYKVHLRGEENISGRQVLRREADEETGGWAICPIYS
jgi:hypothetical protein